ncbi:fimbrial protein [Dyella sp. 20L07]|uniref:fimbrial protein n=1 Tax=Dyella sp. 20L07 TaxID=3384240 RepID=UPI003D2CED3E
MMFSAGLAARRRRFAIWVLALLAMVLTPAAWAAGSCSAPNVPLTLASASVPQNATVGTTFGTATTGSVTFSCNGLPSGYTRFSAQMYGLTAGQLVPAQLPSGTNITSITYASGVAGVGIQLTMNGGMRSYDVTPGDQQSGAYVIGYAVGNNSSVTVNYTAQLIVTGTVAAGTISGLTLGKYEWYIYGNNISQVLGTSLTITGGTQISLAGCSVTTASQAFTVTLPTLSSTAFAGIGTKAGRTAFNIFLNCPASANVSVTMTSPGQSSTIAGLINPTTGTGYATNVGVQLLDQNTNAIPWGTAVSYGKVTAGTNIPLQFYAQYYQTAATIGAGKVTGTATFTMTYQ